ncbi:cell division protein FtsL [Yanghanlia caeni]|uniref:Cell division protein FtsL n=1 Tax=Yanghanlia caeni TaxID=3064283 RepID=A0ABU1D876_9BURK|nr:cell division protein FtsL [Alcaligenaceae bacterium LG-2]NGR09733.1 cell division protein FtsL [bacterium SGD-2]HZH56913.1 cell division protein FtsL [Burkholderiaceae bacterium]
MIRLCIVFSVLLMLSALSLVTARYQSRQLFVAAERLEDRSRELDIEWRRLQLERAELARHARIDQIARRDLGMVTATPDRTLYLDTPHAAQGERR